MHFGIINIKIHQGCAGMTGAALGSVGGHNSAMVRVRRVNCAEWLHMTGRAVAADCKGFPCRQTDSPAIGIMARGTGIMHLGIGIINQGRRITVSVAAACIAHIYQGCVIFKNRMNLFKACIMTGETGYLRAIHTVQDCLRDDCRIHFSPGIIVTKDTIGAMQNINVLIACQGSVTRLTKRRSVAGMAVTAQLVYHPVVMPRT